MAMQVEVRGVVAPVAVVVAEVVVQVVVAVDQEEAEVVALQEVAQQVVWVQGVEATVA